VGVLRAELFEPPVLPFQHNRARAAGGRRINQWTDGQLGHFARFFRSSRNSAFSSAPGAELNGLFRDDLKKRGA